jgi:hypothetical protein
MLDKMDLDRVPQDAEVWEKAIRKLRGGMMPPQGMPRPGQEAIESLPPGSKTRLTARRKGIEIPARSPCTG